MEIRYKIQPPFTTQELAWISSRCVTPYTFSRSFWARQSQQEKL